MRPGEPVHGEQVTDGDASGGIAVILYTGGGVTVRALVAGEFLNITDVQIVDESGGDVWLVADSKAAGRYIVHGNIAANGILTRHFESPYVCPSGVTPKFYGSSGASISSCIIEGFITKI